MCDPVDGVVTFWHVMVDPITGEEFPIGAYVNWSRIGPDPVKYEIVLYREGGSREGPGGDQTRLGKDSLPGNIHLCLFPVGQASRKKAVRGKVRAICADCTKSAWVYSPWEEPMD